MFNFICLAHHAYFQTKLTGNKRLNHIFVPKTWPTEPEPDTGPQCIQVIFSPLFQSLNVLFSATQTSFIIRKEHGMLSVRICIQTLKNTKCEKKNTQPYLSQPKIKCYAIWNILSHCYWHMAVQLQHCHINSVIECAWQWSVWLQHRKSFFITAICFCIHMYFGSSFLKAQKIMLNFGTNMCYVLILLVNITILWLLFQLNPSNTQMAMFPFHQNETKSSLASTFLFAEQYTGAKHTQYKQHFHIPSDPEWTYFMFVFLVELLRYFVYLQTTTWWMVR